MTRVFLCVGVHDGVGSSTLALLLAESLAHENRAVCLLDADPNRCDQIAWHAAHGTLRDLADILHEPAAWYEQRAVLRGLCNAVRPQLIACTGDFATTCAQWDTLSALLTHHAMDLVIDGGTRPLALPPSCYARATHVAIVADHATQLTSRTQRTLKTLADIPGLRARAHLIFNRVPAGFDTTRSDAAWSTLAIPHDPHMLTHEIPPTYLSSLIAATAATPASASDITYVTLDDYCEFVLEQYFADAARTSNDAADLVVDQLLNRFPPPAPLDPSAARVQLLADLDGYGPLTPFLRDAKISEILVNGPTQIWIEQRGCLERTSAEFRNPRHLQRCIDRLLLHSGRRVDVSTPLCDARLASGERVHVAISPIAVAGPYISIRRFLPIAWSLDALLERDAITASMKKILRDLVEARRNVLVVGGTGSGKTTLLNALAAAIAPGERVITIEDAAELQLTRPHVVRLEAKIANMEGEGAVTIRDLVRAALRMRPDRIIVGECRGGEALDMLQAMNTGHQGSMTTIHANGATESLERLATLVAFAGVTLPHAAVISQIRAAIDAIVMVERTANGTRRVQNIFRITDYRNEQWEVAAL